MDLYRPEKWAVTADRDGLVHLANYMTREVLWTAETSREPKVSRFSPDGSKIVLAGELAVTVLLSNDGSEFARFSDHSARINDAIFFSDARIVTSSEDRRVHVYDLEEKKLQARLVGHGSGVAKVCRYGEDRVLSMCHDGDVRCWDLQLAVKTATEAPQYYHRNLVYHVRCVAGRVCV